MSDFAIKMIYDSTSDVLYMKYDGARIKCSSAVEGDDFVILNKDYDGKICGVQIIAASEMTSERWTEHFSSEGIPDDIFHEARTWMIRNNIDLF